MERRLLFLAILFLAAPCFLHAQWIERVKLSAGLQMALPRGDLRTFTSFGPGVYVQAEAPVSGKFTLVASSGWTHLLGKDYGAGKTKGTNAIPFLLGGRYYAFKRLFAGITTGYTLYFAGRSSEGGFTYMPQIGYCMNRLQWIFGYVETHADARYQQLSLACNYRF